METRLVNPHDCRFVQSRVLLDDDTVREYADMFRKEMTFDPCKGVVTDAGAILVYDGNHRGEAAKQEGCMLEVELRPGTEHDAEWLSTGANTRHGLKRSPDDIAKSVRIALRHPNALHKSDREIARHCGCDHKTVGKYRKELEASWNRPQIQERTVTRNGTEYQMKIPMPAEPDDEPAPTPARGGTPQVYEDHMPKVWQPPEPDKLECAYCGEITIYLNPKNPEKSGIKCPTCQLFWKDITEYRRDLMNRHTQPAACQACYAARPHWKCAWSCCNTCRVPPSECPFRGPQPCRLHAIIDTEQQILQDVHERLGLIPETQPEPEHDVMMIDDNDTHAWYTEDRVKIVNAGLTLYRAHKVPRPEIRQFVLNDQQNFGSWRIAETFETVAALKRRYHEMKTDPHTIFEMHL